MASVNPHRPEELLAALETTDGVLAALAEYEAADDAIELLQDDVRAQRALLVEELRAALRPHTRAALGMTQAAA